MYCYKDKNYYGTRNHLPIERNVLNIKCLFIIYKTYFNTGMFQLHVLICHNDEIECRTCISKLFTLSD